MKRGYLNNLPSFFRIAKKASMNSDHHTFKLGACLLKGNRVISTGFNSLKGSTIAYYLSNGLKSRHAEIHCILNAPPDLLKGSTIVVYREGKDGKPRLSKCCGTCIRWLKMNGVNKMIYTTDTGWAEEVIK